MLSRIAESLFWIGRYLERAENTTRIVEVHLQLLLDDPSVDQDDAAHSLLAVMGAAPVEVADTSEVLRALCYDTTSACSIAAALGGAREAACSVPSRTRRISAAPSSLSRIRSVMN